MIQVEEAVNYFLKPIDALEPDYDPKQDYTPEDLERYPDIVYDNALVIGNKFVMNEVAVYMEQNDVLSTVGVFPDRCVIITDLPREKCKEIIAKGQVAWDKKWAEELKKIKEP